MGYESVFWVTLVFTVASILFSRRDIKRWRRMLTSHIILIGVCSFSGALAFFSGTPAIILGLAGLLPASMAAMHLTRNELQGRLWDRKAFRLQVRHPQITPGEALLEEQDRIDEEEEHRDLGRRSWVVFLPAIVMGVTAFNFESWLMAVLVLGVAAVTGLVVQPAFAPRTVLGVPDERNELPRGSGA